MIMDNVDLQVINAWNALTPLNHFQAAVAHLQRARELVTSGD
jgi:hypothetical protein